MSRSHFSWGASPRVNPIKPKETSLPSDELLLQICQVAIEDVQALREWLDGLRLVPRLIGHAHKEAHLELAITLLASLLGQVSRHNPVHLPFGFAGPSVQSRHWIDRDTLERIGKQIAGLVCQDHKATHVAFDVTCAINHAVELGFLEQKQYDAWRPGMPSGSGWRTAMMATPYGLARADMLGASIMSAHETSPDSTSPKSSTPVAPIALDANQATGNTAVPSTDDRYAWARQAELVNAVNHVLGQGMLHKGVLSRACQSKQIETNGLPGRASRVSVPHFMAWAAEQFSIGSDEQIQLRNAIIGEINMRNL